MRRTIDDSRLQALGATLTAAADALARRMRTSDAAAFQLGFLIGATDRGAAQAAGLQGDLANRIAGAARADGGPRRAPLMRGRAAGRRRRMRLRLYHHPDGARIAYREAGAGPGLALFHSLGLSHREWEPVVEPLSQRFRVVLPDLPLHGDSEDRPRHPYTPDGSRRSSPASAARCSARVRWSAGTTSAPSCCCARSSPGSSRRGAWC